MFGPTTTMGAKNISRIMWTMLTLIPITNKDISYNRKNILEDRQLFRALSSHSVPLWPWENWYCRVGHFQRQNHRNEDGQSTESERMSGRCGEYAKLIDRPRNISCPAVIGLPKWGTCRLGVDRGFFARANRKDGLRVTTGIEMKTLKLKSWVDWMYWKAV